MDLVHISQLANQFREKSARCCEGATKGECDRAGSGCRAGKRISLSMRDNAAPAVGPATAQTRQAPAARPLAPARPAPPPQPRQEGFSNRIVIPKVKG